MGYLPEFKQEEPEVLTVVIGVRVHFFCIDNAAPQLNSSKF